MSWHKITLTEKQLAANEHKKLIAAFEKVYNHFKSEAANMALFGAEEDNCTFYVNTIAGSYCRKILEQYAAVSVRPSKKVHRLEGGVGPQIFDS